VDYARALNRLGERIITLVRMKINDDRYHMTTAATFGSRIGPMLIFTLL
jgi:hypothetical protein